MVQLNIQYPNVGKVSNALAQMKKDQFATRQMEKQESFDNWLAQSGYRPGMPGAQNVLQGGFEHDPRQALQLMEHERGLAAEQAKLKTAEISQQASVLKMAIDTKDADAAKALYQRFYPNEEVDFSFADDDVLVHGPNGVEYKGNPTVLASYFGAMNKNPEHFMDPRNVQIELQKLVQSGISVKFPENPESVEKAILAADRRGDRAEVQRLMQIKQEMKGSTSLTVTPEGGVSFVQGGQVPKFQVPFGKGAEKMIDEKIVTGLEQVKRLEDLVGSYDPRYLDKTVKGKAHILDQLEAWGIKKLNPEEQKLVTEVSGYYAKALDNLNQYIKMITGAQMSEKEAERILKAMPDPGTSWWKGQGGTKFKAILDESLRLAKLSTIRYHAYKLQGITSERIVEMMENNTNELDLSEDRLKGIMNAKAAEIERGLKAQGVTGEELKNQVTSQTRALFGI